MRGKTQPPEGSSSDRAEQAEVPPKKSPKNAAGTINPKERNAFYETVAKRIGRRDGQSGAHRKRSKQG